MAKTKEPKAKKVAKKGAYQLEVSVNDVAYKGSAASMVQALTDFVSSKDFPFGVKTRVLLKFGDGKKEGLQRYGALVARRVFKAISHKPSALEILAGKLESRLA